MSINTHKMLVSIEIDVKPAIMDFVNKSFDQLKKDLLDKIKTKNPSSELIFRNLKILSWARDLD